MINQVSLDTWNQCTLALMQALLGAVSPNFRMVTLANDGGVWKLQFVLQSESGADREEIEDVASEFEALQGSVVRYEVDITITADPIAWPPPPTRVVYRRREG
jgi:hypothetical protein